MEDNFNDFPPFVPIGQQDLVTLPAYAGTIRGIKSIQRGSLAFAAGSDATKSATIIAVDMAKSEVRFLGQSTDSLTLAGSLVRIVLADTTTITGTRGTNNGNTTVQFEVTEWA